MKQRIEHVTLTTQYSAHSSLTAYPALKYYTHNFEAGIQDASIQRIGLEEVGFQWPVDNFYSCFIDISGEEGSPGRFTNDM